MSEAFAPLNTILMKQGKKYRAALEKVNRNKLYPLADAVKLVKETSTTKFDSSIEIHLNLDIDTAQADQILRATVSLPHGTGKEVRVIAFVEDAKAKEATAAGAIKAGSEQLVAEIEKGWLDFDVAVAHPSQMKALGKIARVLGQKGLMPNPKAGTVSEDIAKVIAEVKRGKVEFRNDKQGNLHNIVGKASFTAEQLIENIDKYLKTIVQSRPSGVKGTYINSVTLATTMGPGVKVEFASYVR